MKLEPNQNFWVLIAVIFLIGIMSMAASKAFAADTEYTWDTPIERIDGSALPLTEIKHYNLYENNQKIAEVTGNSYIHNGGVFGDICAEISTTDIYDQEGPKSDTVCLQRLPPVPKPPTGFGAN